MKGLRCNLITGNRNFIEKKISDSKGLQSCWQKHPEILLKLDIISWNRILFLCCEDNCAFVGNTSNQLPHPGTILVSAVLYLLLTEMSQPRGLKESDWLWMYDIYFPHKDDGPFCAQCLLKYQNILFNGLGLACICFCFYLVLFVYRKKLNKTLKLIVYPSGTWFNYFSVVKFSLISLSLNKIPLEHNTFTIHFKIDLFPPINQKMLVLFFTFLFAAISQYSSFTSRWKKASYSKNCRLSQIQIKYKC